MMACAMGRPVQPVAPATHTVSMQGVSQTAGANAGFGVVGGVTTR
jgi:hypothetical protein